jgi:hypothetical protein
MRGLHFLFFDCLLEERRRKSSRLKLLLVSRPPGLEPLEDKLKTEGLRKLNLPSNFLLFPGLTFPGSMGVDVPSWAVLTPTAVISRTEDARLSSQLVLPEGGNKVRENG